MDSDIDAAVTQIKDALAVLASAEENLVDAVRGARDVGASWATIGDTLAVTRQAAWQRFASRVGE